MLITRLKNKKELYRMLESRSVFVFKCFGCREVFFPEDEINLFIQEKTGSMKGVAEIDYLCNEEFAAGYTKEFAGEIREADGILVFSCGVGVQVLSRLLENKIILPGCDTLYLKGFQGLSSHDSDCGQCGSCRLNITGGICPITACAKGLLNGPCGGASEEGKCEVSPEMDCGWVLIYKRLKAINGENILHDRAINVRDYSIISGDREERKGNEP